MRRRLLVLTLPIYFGMMVAFVFLKGGEDTPSTYNFKSFKSEVPERPKLPKVTFRDVTAQAGIDFFHKSGFYGEYLMPETMGPGCGFFDFDNDGDQDLFIVNSASHWPHRPQDASKPPLTHSLYRNEGSLQFTEIGREMGLLCRAYGQGVCFGDVDNDGFTDIYITCYGKNVLLRNVEGKRFEEVTARAGVECPVWSVSAAFLDYDKDGLLDLFVGNYAHWSVGIQRKIFPDFKMGSSKGEATEQETPRGEAKPSSPMNAKERLAMKIEALRHKGEYPGPHELTGDFCRLYRNLGDFRFQDVSKEAGILRTDILGKPNAKALGVGVWDYDEDGWPDIAVANDQVPDFLFRNLGDGTYKEVGAQVGMATDADGLSRAGMGIHWADYRNNGSIAVAIGNFTLEKAGLYLSTDKERRVITDIASKEGIGTATFMPVTWGLFFLDYDLDGRQDLYVLNGHFQQSAPNTWEAGYAQSGQMFWNAGPNFETGVFHLASESEIGSDLPAKRVGRGAAYGDIDGDGDLDIFVTTNRGPACLLLNEGPPAQHYLRIKLEGSVSNRSAIGAKVRVKVGNTMQRREVTSGSSYASQSELVITFGLGTAIRAEEVEVIWPAGGVTRLTSVPADQVLLVIEGGG